MSKRVFVLDVGVGSLGNELRWLSEDLPALGVSDWMAHGFEACAESHRVASARLSDLPMVHVHRIAIADREGTCRLYHTDNVDGHSIYATKNNVLDAANNHEDMTCTRASVFLASCPEFPADINILRFNVEGAEWVLADDLDRSGLLSRFQIVCGNCGGDITVVDELHQVGKYQSFLDIMARHGVQQFWYCWDTINDEASRATMRGRIKALL